MYSSHFDWRYIPHGQMFSDRISVSIVSYPCILILILVFAAVFHF